MDSLFSQQVEYMLTRIEDNDSTAANRREAAIKVAEKLQRDCPEQLQYDDIAYGLEECILSQDLVKHVISDYEKNSKQNLGPELVVNTLCEPLLLAEIISTDDTVGVDLWGDDDSRDNFIKIYLKTSGTVKNEKRKEISDLLVSTDEELVSNAEKYIQSAQPYSTSLKMGWSTCLGKTLHAETQLDSKPRV